MSKTIAVDLPEKKVEVQAEGSNLIGALEEKSLNSLCDLIRQGKTERVLQAVNNGANPDVIDPETKYTALDLVIWNGGRDAALPIFSVEDQLLIVNTILSRKPNFIAYCPLWNALFCSPHHGYALCLRLSHFYGSVPPIEFLLEFPSFPSIYFTQKMGALWKTCSIITQPGQAKIAAEILYNFVYLFAPKVKVELLENVLTDLKNELSQSCIEYYAVIAECYKLLIAGKIDPKWVSQFCLSARKSDLTGLINGRTPSNSIETASLCQYAVQADDAGLLGALLAVRGNPALPPTDDFKSYPVRLALCQHPEWLEVKESKQWFLFSTKPKNVRIINYFKQILPQALGTPTADLSLLHNKLLTAHAIKLEDITQVRIYQVIFETVLQPRMKLPDPVLTAVPSSVL